MRIVAPALGALALLAPSSALAIGVADVPNPRASGSWVADTNDMIDAATEARLDEAIGAFEAERGVEIAVVCVDSVDTPTPKDFATALFARWGIGKAGRNDGLLVLMVKGERRLEMETGYGLEPVLTDGWLKSMQQREMVPFFKVGDYGTGLEAGVRASISRLRQYPDGVPAGTDVEPAAALGERSSAGAPPSGGIPWFWVLFGGTVVVGSGGAGAWVHRKNRTCPTCKVRMTMLPEEEDDVHLDEGQKTEESIGSVDHQFHYCTTCDFARLLPVGRWFSGFSTCSSCGYKTSSSTSSTITPATYTQSGVREIVVTCAHCNHHAVSRRTIPMLTRSSSSSGGSSFSSGGGGGGGGGSSFGGGSSGGGGAGSSW